MRRGNRLGWCVAPLCAMSLFLAACGDDEDSASKSGADAPAAAETAGKPLVSDSVATAFKSVTGLDPLTKEASVEELEPRVAEYKATPTKLLQDEPVSKKAEPGKTMALLVCGVPVCSEFNDAAKEAADLLGWKVERVDLGVSPEEFTAAYDRAIEIKPDIVVGSGLSRELFDKQLTTLEKQGVPVIQWSSGNKPIDGALWVATDNPLYEARGLQIAEFLALDGKMDADTVIFNVPQYVMSELFGKTVRDYLPKICSDCSVGYEEVAVTDIGKLGEKVTAYVQRKPDTKYVVCTFGDLCQGVGQSLKAAGSDAKVVTEDGGTTNYQNMVNGLEHATSPLSIGQTGWQIVDLAQRIFNGDDTSGTRLQPMQVVTADQIKDPKSPLIGAVPDYKEQYKALWKLEG